MYKYAVNLIVHTFHPQALIRPRAFISWSMSATYGDTYYPATRSDADCEEAHGPKGFITVQVPFYLAKPTAPDSQFKDLYAQIMDAVPPRTVFAYYASVERVELLPPAAPSASANESTRAQRPHQQIRWTMATTSEAAGEIPKWVQRSWMLGEADKRFLWHSSVHARKFPLRPHAHEPTSTDEQRKFIDYERGQKL
jgi:hypothetical protein